MQQRNTILSWKRINLLEFTVKLKLLMDFKEQLASGIFFWTISKLVNQQFILILP